MERYIWDTGEETKDIIITIPRKFRVIATKNGCTDTVFEVVKLSNGIADTESSYTVNGLTYSFQLKTQNKKIISWDFGDGSTSSESNPIHTYANPGYYNVDLNVEDICGDKGNSIIPIHVVDNVTRINSNASFTQILLYPNPTSDKIKIVLNKNNSEKLTCEIINMQGQILSTWNFDNNEIPEIDIKNFRAGMYMLRLKLGNMFQIQRVIKE